MPVPARKKTVSLLQNGTVKSILRGTLGTGGSGANDYVQTTNAWTTFTITSVGSGLTGSLATWCPKAFEPTIGGYIKSASPISTATSNFSFCFRFKVTTLPAPSNFSTLFFNGDSTNIDGYLIYIDDLGTLNFLEVNKSNTISINSISTGQWYHVAVTVNGSGDVVTYLNGSISGSGGTSVLFTAPTTQTYFFTYDGTQYLFDGLITDFVFFEGKVLTAKDVGNLNGAVLH